MTKVNWGSEKIQQIIPHRYPMLLIDRVEEVVPGEMAIAKRNVTIHEEVFNGHFPHNPVLPGALIVESLAQTGAVALLSAPQFKRKNRLLRRDPVCRISPSCSAWRHDEAVGSFDQDSSQHWNWQGRGHR